MLETFELFSQTIPSNNLGFVDAKAQEVDFDVGQKSFTISQSPGLLNSDRAKGTTGAVIWKVTPLIAQWLVDKSNFLWHCEVLTSTSVVVELGCGIGGIIGLVLHDHVHQYILSDQPYVMKPLRLNLTVNNMQTGKGKQPSQAAKPLPSNLHLLAFDWEEDSAQNLLSVLDRKEKGIDLLIACDCIYNDFLIGPFVDACKETCLLRRKIEAEGENPTVLLVAQQQRSDDVFQSWLQETMKFFRVWRVPDSVLPQNLQSGSGYIVHIAMLKEE